MEIKFKSNLIKKYKLANYELMMMALVFQTKSMKMFLSPFIKLIKVEQMQSRV